MNIFDYIHINLRKILKTALGVIFILSLMSSLINLWGKNVWVKKAEFMPLPFDAQRENDYVARFENLLPLSNEENNFLEQYPLSRNFFIPVHQKVYETPFYIEEIVFDPFFIMYMGNIEKSKGEIIAQINWGEKTYFVTEGESIQEWTVMQIHKDRVSVMNPEGEERILPIHERIFSKKPFAKVRSINTGKSTKLSIGNEIEGYKVLDITPSTVIICPTNNNNSKDLNPIIIKK